jgi:hypothetical protein
MLAKSICQYRAKIVLQLPGSSAAPSIEISELNLNTLALGIGPNRDKDAIVGTS